MAFELKFLKSYQPSSGKTRKRSPILTLIAGLAFVLSTSYLLYVPPKKVIDDYTIKVGDIAKENIEINKDVFFEDKHATQELRQKARAEVTPVYEWLKDNETKSSDRLQRWVQLIRDAKVEYLKNEKKETELATIKENIEKEFGLEFTQKEIRSILVSEFFTKVDIDQLLTFVKNLYQKRILISFAGANQSTAGTINIHLKDRNNEVKKVSTLYDLNKAKSEVANFVRDQRFGKLPVNFITNVLMQFIYINISYSQNLTLDEQQTAAIAVNPVMKNLKKGKIILRKGDEVTPEIYEELKLIQVEAKTRAQTISNFYLIALVLIFLTLFGNKFFKIWSHSSVNKEKLFVVMGATITVSAIVYRASIFLFPLIMENLSQSIAIEYNIQSIYFAIPFGFGVLTVAFVYNLQSAVIFSFINAIIGTMVCGWDFSIFLYILTGNLAVSYGIEYYQRLKRSPIIKASFLWLLPSNIVMITIFHLTGNNFDWLLLLVNVVTGIFAALAAPILANFTIPLWESMFQLVTELKLVELSNLNLPIFREMLEKAPGTYHHSQMVATLSEAAAQDLGLSPLLVRAMALYHDIGKIDGPHYFTENHTMYRNPHPNLSPRESAKNIIAHINDGVERAKKLNLPPMVMSAISQHHGTKLVRFFYDKAKEVSSVDSDGFDDKSFRYPGEKPKNIENAVIMLADQVEAASKSLASPTDVEIKNVIRKIIDTNIEEAQFNECEGLTFKNLNIIANSFHKKLHSIYHMRVSYPGFDFKDKEKQLEEPKGAPALNNASNIKMISS